MGRLSFPLPVEVAGVPAVIGGAGQRVWFPVAETVFLKRCSATKIGTFVAPHVR
jgi:hypothetical protein